MRIGAGGGLRTLTVKRPAAPEATERRAPTKPLHPIGLKRLFCYGRFSFDNVRNRNLRRRRRRHDGGAPSGERSRVGTSRSGGTQARRLAPPRSGSRATGPDETGGRDVPASVGGRRLHGLRSRTAGHPAPRVVARRRHDYSGVPTDLSDRLRSMASTPAAIIKLAVQAHRLADCEPIFGLSRLIPGRRFVHLQTVDHDERSFSRLPEYSVRQDVTGAEGVS